MTAIAQLRTRGHFDRISYVNAWLADNPHPCGTFLCDRPAPCDAWWTRYLASWDEPMNPA